MISPSLIHPVCHPFSRLNRQLVGTVNPPAITESNGSVLRVVCPVCNIFCPFLPCGFICSRSSRRNLYALRFFRLELTACKMNCLPLHFFQRWRLASLHDYAFQIAASSKCSRSYTCHAVWNRYFCQTAAFTKCTHFYTSHTAWNRYFCQTAASNKCTQPYAYYAVRDRYFCQIATVNECHLPYACHAVRNHYTCKTGAALKRTRIYLCHAVWNRYTCKFFALLKCTSSNTYHAVWNRYVFQTSA